MSSKRLTGQAKIVVDGQTFKTDGAATLNPGGVNRASKVGNGEVHGYSEEDVVPSVECVVFHDKDTSLKYLSNITGATVFFECDSGAQFVLRDAWTMEPATLTAKDGSASLKMEAVACDEL